MFIDKAARARELDSVPLARRERLFAFAQQAADRARPIALRYAQLLFDRPAELGIELKADFSPVTLADKEIEQLIRELIMELFPGDGITGEEGDDYLPEALFKWTVDPVDGTDHLAVGIPTFGLMVGLRYKGHALFGMIDHPLLNIRTVGVHGLGVTSNGRKIVLAEGAEPALRHREIAGLSTREIFERTGDGKVFDAVTRQWPNHRIFYDCSAHSYAIRGGMGAVLEYNIHTWDFTPTEAMILEAGGEFVRVKQTPDPRCPHPFESVLFGNRRAVERMHAIIQPFLA